MYKPILRLAICLTIAPQCIANDESVPEAIYKNLVEQRQQFNKFWLSLEHSNSLNVKTFEVVGRFSGKAAYEYFSIRDGKQGSREVHVYDGTNTYSLVQKMVEVRKGLTDKFSENWFLVGMMWPYARGRGFVDDFFADIDAIEIVDANQTLDGNPCIHLRNLRTGKNQLPMEFWIGRHDDLYFILRADVQYGMDGKVIYSFSRKFQDFDFSNGRTAIPRSWENVTYTEAAGSEKKEDTRASVKIHELAVGAEVDQTKFEFVIETGMMVYDVEKKKLTHFYAEDDRNRLDVSIRRAEIQRNLYRRRPKPWALGGIVIISFGVVALIVRRFRR